MIQTDGNLSRLRNCGIVNIACMMNRRDESAQKSQKHPSNLEQKISFSKCLKSNETEKKCLLQLLIHLKSDKVKSQG